MNRNLSNIKVADLGTAKQRPNTNAFAVCPSGVHVAKVLGFFEGDTYNTVSLEIDGTKYNFFYDYMLRDGSAFDADVLNWIISLATIPVTDSTGLMEIANSAIGSSYKIEIYNYTAKTGKNAGKLQHAIQFSTKPELTVVDIQTEDFVLPY